jgi:hypothetical protein
MDLSGAWGQKLHEDGRERLQGPDLGDYTGLPVNDRARAQADAFDADKWIEREHQCEPHPADYAVRGPGSMRVWADLDPLTQQITAWHTALMWMNTQRTIYMDGRPHPSEYAPHTWGGFSTGVWIADMLKVETTHLKGRLATPQRAPAQRKGRYDRVLPAAWRLPDGSDDCERPRVPDRFAGAYF